MERGQRAVLKAEEEIWRNSGPTNLLKPENRKLLALKRKKVKKDVEKVKWDSERTIPSHCETGLNASGMKNGF